MKADELWEKYCKLEMIDNHFYDVMSEKSFLAALAEYGQAVRERDKELTGTEICDCCWSDDAKAARDQAIGAVSREPLP